jgi:hypothetical protein
MRTLDELAEAAWKAQSEDIPMRMTPEEFSAITETRKHPETEVLNETWTEKFRLVLYSHRPPFAYPSVKAIVL